MTTDASTAPERIVLEIIDGLGGRSEYGTIKGMIRKQLRSSLRATMSPMLDRGWLVRSFAGQYAITEEGRRALRRMQSISV
jgi:predicted transcriptional regulator